MVPQKNDSYCYVKLYTKDNENKTYSKTVAVHRLVAKHFLEDYQKEKQIHHKNGNPSDNNSQNLLMVSAEEHFEIHRKMNEKEENQNGKKAESKENTN